MRDSCGYVEDHDVKAAYIFLLAKSNRFIVKLFSYGVSRKPLFQPKSGKHDVTLKPFTANLEFSFGQGVPKLLHNTALDVPCFICSLGDIAEKTRRVGKNSLSPHQAVARQSTTYQA